MWKIKLLLSIFSFFLMSVTCGAYDWPLTPISGPHNINATLGEFRKGTVNNHFHAGVDMQADVGDEVLAVETGIISIINGSGCDEQVNIGNFAYTHIIIDQNVRNNPGQSLNKGELVGKIKAQASGCPPKHLHFEENPIGIRNNPLASLVNYKDTSPAGLPEVWDVTFFDADTNKKISLTKPIKTRYIKVRARAKDKQSNGSKTTGVYEIGYVIQDNNNNDLIPYVAKQTYNKHTGDVSIAYDENLSNHNKPAKFYYWASNSKNSIDRIDLHSLQDAPEYKLCVLAKDIIGNGGEIAARKGAECKTFQVEKSSDCSNDIINPKISFTNFESCVNTNDVEITGIANDNCELSAVTVNGVSAVISSNTFTASLVLQDGNHGIKAIATDISGNSAMVEEDLTVDTVAPNPLTFTPPNGTKDVMLSSPVSVTFDEEIEDGNLTVFGPLAGFVIVNGDTLSFQHGGLAKDQFYTVLADGVKDSCGNTALPASWSFTAAPFQKQLQPPQDNNGQPIDPNKWINTDSITQCGSVDNPDGPAEVTITAGSLYSDSKSLPQGQGSYCFTFDIPEDFEGIVPITVCTTYLEKTVCYTNYVKVDNKAPILSTNLTDGISVSTNIPELKVNAVDGGSKMGTVMFYNLFKTATASDQKSALADNGVADPPLQLGPNILHASATDLIGNSTSTLLTVHFNGAVTVTVDVIDVLCEQRLDLDLITKGTPGLSGEYQITQPKGGVVPISFTIDNSGTSKKSFRGTETGDYDIRYNIYTNATSPPVQSGRRTALLDACARGDPTFIEENPIFVNKPPERPEAFSPVSSAGEKDTFDSEYAAVYAQTLVDIQVYNQTGQNIKTIFQGPRGTGIYPYSWDGTDGSSIPQPDGLYTITIKETNLENQSLEENESLLVEIDNSTPSITLDRIEVSEINSNFLRVFGDIVDNNPDRFTLYQVTNSIVTPILTGAVPGDAGQGNNILLGEVDTTPWAAGAYYIRLEAVDRAENKKASIEADPSVMPEEPHSILIIKGDLAQPLTHLSGSIEGQTALNEGGENQPPDAPVTFVDDELPQSAVTIGNWDWNTSIVYSGDRSHFTSGTGPLNDYENKGHGYIKARHGGQGSPGFTLIEGENLVQYVYLDSNVRQILLQVYSDFGNGEHRVFWGADEIQTGGGSRHGGQAQSLVHAGPLPPSGQWVRLRIPIETLGLANQAIKGLFFSSPGGTAVWDKTTKSNTTLDPGGLGYTLPPTSTDDDATETTLLYTLDRPTSLKVDILDTNNTVIKTLVNGSSGDPQCCSAGRYRLLWDQRNDSNDLVPDGIYAFQLSSTDGAFDTAHFGFDLVFDSNVDPFPSIGGTRIQDANGNIYEVDASSPTRVIKKNSEDLFIAEIFDLGKPIPILDITVSSGTVQGLAFDADGNLFAKDSFGRVHKFAAGRLYFAVHSLTAKIRVPFNKSMVKATVPIIGAATGKQFKEYFVEVAQGWAPKSDPDANSLTNWEELHHGLSEVIDNFVIPPGHTTIYGNLASWETGLTPGEEFPEQDIFNPQTSDLYRGRWTVRLRAYNISGASKTTTLPVIVGRVINNATGGLIRSDDNHVRVVVPPLSLDRDWSVFSILHHDPLAPVPDDTVPPIPAGFSLVGHQYEMIPQGKEFGRPLHFEIVRPDEFAEAPNIALYSYNFKEENWQFVSDTFEVNGASETIYTNEDFKMIPDQRGFFALLSRTGQPDPPMLYELASPTKNRFVTFRGEGEPFAEVAVFDTQQSTSSVPAVGFTNESGDFLVSNYYLSPGTASFQAVQSGGGGRIGSGVLSGPSNTVSIEIEDTPPVLVSSITFLIPELLQPKLNNFKTGEQILLHVTGTDPNPSGIDETYALLRSTATDPLGIFIRLIETEINSGQYLGGAALGDQTNQAEMKLGAVLEGEIIEAFVESDPNQKVQLYFEDPIEPETPLITSASHPSFFQDTFERDLNQWAMYDLTAGADIARTTSSKSGVYAVRLTQNKPDGNFSAIITQTPVNIKTNPIFQFEVRMEEEVRFNLFFRYKGAWLEYVLNDAGEIPKFFPPAFDVLGSHLPDQRAAALESDGQWQTVTLNLFNLFKNKFPDLETEEDFTVEQILIGDWDAQEFFGLVSGNTPQGSWVEFDNVILTNAGVKNPNPEFSWLVDKPELTEGFSYSIDQLPGSVPADFINTRTYSHRQIGVESGFYYFHLRAQDINRNWGSPNHYKFLIDSLPPTVSNPFPAPNSRSESLVAQVTVEDPVGYGLNMESVLFTINGIQYDINSQALDFNADTNRLSISIGDIKPVPPNIVDGQLITFSIDAAEDWAGNKLADSFEWSWQADFSRFAGGDFAPLTVNGGREPAWSPDGGEMAFISDRGGQTDLWVMDALDAGETNNSTSNLTDDAAVQSAPAYSPNGLWIAYASNESGNNDIWAIHRVDKTKKQLTTHTDEDLYPAWSPDGTQLVFSRKTPAKAVLYTVQVDSTTLDLISETRLSQEDIGFNLEAEWHPNGQQIIYRKFLYVNNIYTVNADGTNPIALTDSRKDFMPAIKPDQRSVAFVTKRNGDINTLWIMDPDGQNQRELLNNNNVWPDAGPAWAPDGSRLAFSTRRSGAENIWILSLLEVTNYKAEPAIFSHQSNDGPVETTLSYRLSAADALVNLTIENDSGFSRRLLVNENQSGGDHSIIWDGKDDAGIPGAGGDYLAHLQVEGLGAPDPIVKVVSIGLDLLKPQTQVFPNSVFISTQTGITLTSVDIASAAASGLRETFYSINGSTPILYTNPFSLPGGTQTVTGFSFDQAGNRSIDHNKIYLVDDERPLLTSNIIGPQALIDTRLFVSSDTSIHYELTDQKSSSTTILSGPLEIEINDGAGTNIHPSSSVVLSLRPYDDGPRSFAARGSDKAGNFSNTETHDIIIDAVSPLFDFSFNPPAVNNGVRDFITRQTSVTFLTSDFDSTGSTVNASGPSHVLFQVDSGSVTPRALTDVVRFDQEGEYLLNGRTVDFVENKSELTSRPITVTDLTPSTRLIRNGPYFKPFISPQTTYFIELQEGAQVQKIEINLDGAGYVDYSTGTPINFPLPGEHTLVFRAVRLNATVENEESITVFTDTGTPTTQISFSTPTLLGAGTRTIGGHTEISLVSVETGDPQSGVLQTQFSIAGETSTVLGPFDLNSIAVTVESTYTLTTWAVDQVENRETLQSETIVLDNTAPISTMVVTGPQYENSGFLFVSSETLFSILAEDSGPTASGVETVFYSTGSSFIQYTSSFQLTNSGETNIQRKSTDKVGNLETTKTLTVINDIDAPSIGLEFLGNHHVAESTTIIHATTLLVFSAPDDLSGLDILEFAIDGGAFNEAAGPFSLTLPGLHTLTARARDNIGNTRELDFTVFLDTVPPQSEIVLDGGSLTRGATLFIRADTLIGFQAFDAASSIKRILYQVDNQFDLQTFTSSFTLTAGPHSLNFFAEDLVGNVEPANPLNIFVENQAPESDLTFNPPAFSNGVNTYISENTTITVTSTEAPLDEGAGLGDIFYSLEGSSFTSLAVSTGTQELSGSILVSSTGTLPFQVFSEDLIGNSEDVKTFNFIAGEDPPSVILSFNGPFYQDENTNWFGSLDTEFVLTSTGTNIKRIEYRLDNSSPTVYSDPVPFITGGSHTVSFYGVRLDDSLEKEESFSITIDTSVPRLSFELVGGAADGFDGAALTYLHQNTSILLSADDLNAAANSGLKEASYQPFGLNKTTLPGPIVSGVPISVPLSTHPLAVELRAEDHVGGVSLIQARWALDMVSPHSNISLSGSPFEMNGKTYVSGATLFTLTSTDTSSGLDRIETSMNGGDFELYSGPFKLTGEGEKKFKVRGVDGVGNIEEPLSFDFILDDQPPTVDFIVKGSTVARGDVLYSRLDNTVRLEAQDTGVGLSTIEIQFDDDERKTYDSLPFVFPSTGPHTLLFNAVDKLNQRSSDTLVNFTIDNEPPVSSLHFSTGPYFVFQSSVVIGVDTRATLVSTDTGVGVDFIKASINGGSFDEVTGPLSFNEGVNSLAFYSQDLLGYRESTGTYDVWVDTIPPAKPVGFTHFIASDILYLTWSAGSEPDLAGYNLFESSGLVASFGPEGGPFSRPVPENKRLFYTLTAFDGVGNSSAEAELELIFGDPDEIPPAPVSDLALRAVSSHTITATGTWPGDDGLTGETTGTYRLDMSTDSNKTFSTSSFVLEGTVQLSSGTTFSFNVDNLSASTTYYAALFTADELFNWSEVSNIASTQTLPVWFNDSTPPETTLTLLSSTGPVQLTAVDFNSNGVPSGVKNTFYAVDGGTFSLYSSPFDLSIGTHTVQFYSIDVAGNVESTKTANIQLNDITPPAPVSDLAVVSVSSRSISVSFSLTGDDGLTGETTGRFRISVSTETNPNFSTATFVVEETVSLVSGNTVQAFVPNLLPESDYKGVVFLADESLNWSSASNIISTRTLVSTSSDTLPPVTSVTFFGRNTTLFGRTLIAVQTDVGFDSIDEGDPPSGVHQIFYQVNGGSVTLYAENFRMPIGKNELTFYAVDYDGNTETQKTETIFVGPWAAPGLYTSGQANTFGFLNIAGDVQSQVRIWVTVGGKTTGDVIAPQTHLPRRYKIKGDLINEVPDLGFLPLDDIKAETAANNNNDQIPPETKRGADPFPDGGTYLKLNPRDSITLTTGVYVLDGIRLRHKSKLEIDGEVRIYLKGDLIVDGNASIKTSELTSDCIIVSADDGRFRLIGSKRLRLHGYFYFPGKRITTIGAPRIHGGIWVKAQASLGELRVLNDNFPFGGAIFEDFASNLDPAFRLGEVYSFPNPAKSPHRPTFHIESGLADNVKVKVFDITGRVVFEDRFSGTPQMIDDGQGLEFAYEIPWTGHIPSGTYFFEVETEKSGAPPLRYIGKLGVVR